MAHRHTITKMAGAAALAMMLGGCIYISTTEREVRHSVGDDRLHGSRVMADAVAITVPSNGCTAKGDYAADVEKDDGVWAVRFERLREDHCRAFLPEGVELTWTFAELGVPPGARVVVRHYSRR